MQNSIIEIETMVYIQCCDKECGYAEYVRTTAHSVSTPIAAVNSAITNKLRQIGWKYHDENQFLCPYCNGDYKHVDQAC